MSETVSMKITMINCSNMYKCHKIKHSCLSVLNHFVRLPLKGLTEIFQGIRNQLER